MNSASPRTVRRGYSVTTERTVSENGITRRWRTVISPSGSGSSLPVDALDLSLDFATILSASSSRPWMNSHRGLSGTLRRTIRIAEAENRAQPEAQPPADVDGEDAGVEGKDRQQRAAAGAGPVAAVDRRCRRARGLRGRDQLVDCRVDRAYSPPIPNPVKKRNT